jgi:hypothetical protein
MRARTGLLLLSVALFLLSLSQTAFCLDPTGRQGHPAHECYYGWVPLVWGIFALHTSWANLTWLANPAVILAWLIVLARRRIASVVLGVIAVAAAAAFPFASDVSVYTASALQPASLLSVELGYWLWLASTAAALAAAFMLFRTAGFQPAS